MWSSAVRPRHVRSPTSASSVVYCLALSQPLPAFDPKPTLKSTLLSPAAVKRYNNAMRRIMVAIPPAYCIGFALRAASLFISQNLGHVFVLVSIPLQIPLIIHIFLGLRSNFVRALLGYFELWFQYFMLTVWLVMLGWAFDGIHIAIIPVMWLEFSNALLIEASQIMNHRLFVIGSIAVALYMFTLIIGVSLDVFEGVKYHDLIITEKFTVTTQDILINSMTTLGMFFARLVYIATRIKNRKRRIKKKRGGTLENRSMTTMRSVHFRSVLKWQVVDRKGETSVVVVPTKNLTLTQGESFSSISTVSSTSSSTDHLQLTPVENKTLFDSAITVCPLLAGKILRSSSHCHRAATARLILLLGILGVVTSSFSLLQSTPSHILVITALASTLGYATIMVACYQRQLLKQLSTSFNFIFLTIQISLALGSLCDAFSWRKDKVMSAVAWWIWLHLVLTVDALTPVVKSRLLFKVWYSLPVILLTIAGMVAWVIEHVWWGEWQLHDGVIWNFQLRESQDVAFHSSSLLLGRLVTLIIWLLRVIYRVGRRCSDDELVLLQGAAEFDYVRWRQRRPSFLSRSANATGAIG